MCIFWIVCYIYCIDQYVLFVFFLFYTTRVINCKHKLHSSIMCSRKPTPWRNLENNALSSLHLIVTEWAVAVCVCGVGGVAWSPPPTQPSASRFRNNLCKDDSALFSRSLCCFGQHSWSKSGTGAFSRFMRMSWQDFHGLELPWTLVSLPWCVLTITQLGRVTSSNYGFLTPCPAFAQFKFRLLPSAYSSRHSSDKPKLFELRKIIYIYEFTLKEGIYIFLQLRCFAFLRAPWLDTIVIHSFRMFGFFCVSKSIVQILKEQTL